MVEQPAVNRLVASSNLARGAIFFQVLSTKIFKTDLGLFSQGQHLGQQRFSLVDLCARHPECGDRPMKPFISRRKGTTRTVILVGPLALKIARSAEGRRCNQRERQPWLAASQERRKMLCPTLLTLLKGAVAVQPRAFPMSEEDAEHRRTHGSFPSWDYRPGESHGDPTESKATDWGYLRGRSNPIALDYGLPDDCG